MKKAATQNSPSKTDHQRRTGSPALHLALIALVGLLAYANTLHVPFVFDDNSSIVDNPVIKNLSAFLSGAGYAYNPRRFVGYLSFALNYRLGGLDVTGYHAVNIAIHIANAWLVYALARLTLGTPFFQGGSKPLHPTLIPLLAALLFVAHPVQTQAVTYIVQRLASLAAMFYLLSLLLYVRARLIGEGTGKLLSPGTTALYLLCLASAILAMRTKETAATLPLVLLLYEFSFFGAKARKKLLLLVPLLLTLLIVALGMLHTEKPLGELISDVSEMARQSRTISRGDYLLTQSSVVVTYLRLLVLPVNQNLDYDYPIYHSLFTPRVFLSVLFLSALFGLALYLFYRSTSGGQRATSAPAPSLPSRLIAFGILWFFITLSVESSLIPISDVIFEHRLYLPSVGAFFALATMAALLFRRYPPRTFVTAAAIAVLTLAAATWHRNLAWTDDLALWSDAAAKSPDKYRPHNNLGNSLNARGRFDEAIEQQLLALKATPDSPEACNNLGSVYERQGAPEKAAAQFREALRLKPDYAEACANLGNVYQKQGKTEQALALHLKAVELKPGLAAAHNSLGALYKTQGLEEKAMGEFLAAIRLDPDFADAYVNLGETCLKRGLPGRAAELLQSALKLSPAHARAHYSLGVVADLNGNFDEAIRRYETVLKLDPAFPEAANNLGIDYGGKGMVDQAIAQFQAAVRQNPKDADYHFNLAKAYGLKGWTAKATEEEKLAQGLGGGISPN